MVPAAPGPHRTQSIGAGGHRLGLEGLQVEDRRHFGGDNSGHVFFQVQLHQAADVFAKQPDLDLVPARWFIAPHQDRRQDRGNEAH